MPNILERLIPSRENPNRIPKRKRGDILEEMEAERRRAKESCEGIKTSAFTDAKNKMDTLMGILREGLEMDPEKARVLVGNFSMDDFGHAQELVFMGAALAARQASQLDDESREEYEQLLERLTIRDTKYVKVGNNLSGEEAEQILERMKELLGFEPEQPRLTDGRRDSLGE